VLISGRDLLGQRHKCSGLGVHGSRFTVFISQKMFTKSFCKSQFPLKFVNLSFTTTDINNELSDLCGN